jgi:hypothetical protein
VSSRAAQDAPRAHPEQMEGVPLRKTIRAVRGVLGGLALVGLTASTAFAQSEPAVAFSGGVDVTNQYNFRGIRQNTSGVSLWPFIDMAIPAWSGDGALKAVTVNVGTWNALNSQLSGNKGYETDLYATLGLGFGATAVSFNYTSYTSPGDYFTHVKELGVKLAYDDSGALGAAAVKPYALVAFELDGDGQADGGAGKGTYLELGVAPGVTGSKASLAVPIKVGLSANDYYEFGTGSDSAFGYFSVAGIVTVPFGSHFNVHGGVELQSFSDTLRAYNAFGDDDESRVAGLASIGVGFSF